MQLFEKKTSGQLIYDGKIIKVEKDNIVLPNGKESTREVVRHRGGAALLVIKDGKVLLERQFRYAYGEVIWEIPAGKLEKGEKPEATAVRELEEEAGLIAEDVSLMYKIYPTPGYTDEIIYIYKVEKVSQGKTHFDEDEMLDSVWIDLDKAYQMIDDGEIKDAKTIIALLTTRCGK